MKLFKIKIHRFEKNTYWVVAADPTDAERKLISQMEFTYKNTKIEIESITYFANTDDKNLII